MLVAGKRPIKAIAIGESILKRETELISVLFPAFYYRRCAE
ncbi:MAG: hypothetical protein PWP05_76 [Thermovirga sp.]|jgi:hypothetical protein|nr:hypothetical protein [Thermovirga sp.]MDN5367361.1 hypothetical protein [Thermovirga sp.]